VVQLLQLDPELRPDQRWRVETLDAAGRHLLAIVNDALDLAKIDAGRLEIECIPLSPRAVAEDCLALVRPAAAEKRLVLGLEVAGDVPSSVLGDATRLRQILLNLSWNAVKFTPAGGSITLRARIRDGLSFEVLDTGAGIAPGNQVLLFQEFSQLQREGSGTGLGLSLSANLAARMGGSLSYLPGPNGIGSLFRLTLPWIAVRPQPVGAEPETAMMAPVDPGREP
jgi:signal transduction histidine kinase